LGAELALLGVHRPDEEEPGSVPHRDALALDVRGAQRGGVEEQVDQVVVQQVDLVHVEDAAVGGSEQARLEGLDPLGQRPLEVEGPDDAVLGGAHGQLHQTGRAGLAGCCGVVGTVRATRVGHGGVTGEPAAGDDVHGRQDGGQGADRRRFGGALLAAHEHAADGGGDGVEQQGQAHVVHADDGAEGVGHAGRPSTARVLSPGVHARRWQGRRREFPGSRIDARPRPSRARDDSREQWPCMGTDSPVTVAGPRRNLTGLPPLPSRVARS
jgi:hypothetical protein